MFILIATTLQFLHNLLCFFIARCCSLAVEFLGKAFVTLYSLALTVAVGNQIALFKA